MANYYDEQLSHMRHLMDYGMKNESKKVQYTSVMNKKEGADGRVYGIVFEGTKYYIKSCPKGKENLTESFDYIGGFVNRKNCMYSSYADAVKDMDMRLMSLNEDHGKIMPINEMKRSSDLMDAGMVEMQESIARHRQILENIDVIYQGGKGKIGDRNVGVPEAPKTQDFNTKVGDPFNDNAEYEENRDNKENAKDHEKQGEPFSDKAEYKENTDNIQKQDSNTPGDTYTKKAEYVPDNAVAVMNPSGGKVVRVNESLGMEEKLDSEENHFPEENPDLGAEELGELGDGSDELSPEDMEGGIPVDGDELESDELLSQFNDEDDEYLDSLSKPTEEGEVPEIEDMKPSDGVSNPDNQESHLAGDEEEIAGIDDMSGVDRNNLSAEVIDDVVSEMVERFSKNKKMNMISESVAKSILKEMFDEKSSKNNDEDDSERQYYHDDYFMYGVPERPTKDSDFKSASPLSQYMDKGSMVKNVSKTRTLDPRKGATAYVNPSWVDYDPESEYYLQNKFELGLNDEQDGDYTKSSAWKATEEQSRKYAIERVAKVQAELEMLGRDLNIDTEKTVDTFRHATYVLQTAKNNLAIIARIHPEMIEKFLKGNDIPFRNVVDRDDEGNLYGYKDAKDTVQCIITPNGELPKGTDMGDDNKYTFGPSLKAMGFPDMSTDKLTKLVENLDKWDETYGAMLEKEEYKMRESLRYIQSLETNENVKYVRTLKNTSTEWVSLLEDIAGLQSFAMIPMEVLNKREEAKNKWRSRGVKNVSGGYEEYDASSLFGGRRMMREDKTVLHDFGNHPGYRKKPMTTPANIEVAPNGARDWNDDSTKGDEPFGKKIGSSAPYDKIVDMVTREVLKALGEGGQN